MTRLPPWLRVRAPSTEALERLRPYLDGTHTVCESAQCPNRGDCFGRGTATFMLLGDRCTRRCGYCSVSTARPLPLDAGEPGRVAEAAARMGLRYVVLTSVNEGTPVTIIEALAAGRPIVATDVGGVRDVVRNGLDGFLVGLPEFLLDRLELFLEEVLALGLVDAGADLRLNLVGQLQHFELPLELHADHAEALGDLQLLISL